MKSQADYNRREVNFQVGDYVYLKLRSYRQTSVAFRGSMKLAARYLVRIKSLKRWAQLLIS